MKPALLTVAAMVLSGCAHYYVKPGVTPAELNADIAYCRSLGNGGGAYPADQIERPCMVGKGYTVVRSVPKGTAIY